MKRTTVKAIGILAAVLMAGIGRQERVFGQLSSTSRQTMFGSRTLGGFPTAGTRTFSGSSLGSSSISGFGSSRLGRTGTLGTGSSLGRTGLGIGTGLGSLQLSGTERFMRGARQPGQFVGADTQDVSGILSAVGAGARGMSAQNFNARAISGMGQSRLNQPAAQPGGGGGGRTARAARSAADQLAVTLQLGFQAPQVSNPAVLSETLTAKIGQSKRIQALRPIQVLLAEDGTAVLKGVVATPHDRELAALWLLLEPGVRAVRNELEVGLSGSGQTAPDSAQNR